MDDLHGLDGLLPPPLGRRGVIMTSLVAGFTLATARGEAAPIKTDNVGLDAGEISIPTTDGRIPAYVAAPVGAGRFPTVVVIEEIFGVHEYIKDTCRRLAKAGYLAIAPELYARLGDLSTMTDAAQIVRDVISKAPDAQVLSDLDSAASWATTEGKGDPGRIAVTGFCRGGRNTWLYAASSDKPKAAVAWYGPVGGTPSAIQPRNAADVAAELRCPLLGLYGGADTGIPVDQVRAAEAAARQAGKTVEIVVYPDAPHGFHADYRPSFRQEPAEDGWKRMLDWFRRNGVA
ncbi:dienelactone hydrolase family protein [Roseomonas sp. BN140053]|uniref:dienelactone hydrolase family protein n=1 Tax=Roseomonas sp. BN140053 TaxID=3391898 RepID=UPI0039EBCD24